MKYAWLFPGQGSQAVGMGKALYESSKAAREVFERADAALGFSISKICFEGPDGDLTLTENTQPALVTTSIAALAALQEAYPELPAPAFVLGHSLGEYSALVASQALSLEDAVRTVRIRGRAMQDAVPVGLGGMAAIMGGDEAQVRALCEEAQEGDVLSPANFNSPGQVVIAGHQSAIQRAVELCKAKNFKAIVLKVSAPFHCALMASAGVKVREALAAGTISAPKYPVIANVDAKPNASADRVSDLLVQQVDSAVLWEHSILHASSHGVTKALEIGSGKVLAGLVKRIDKNIAVTQVGAPGDLEGVAAFLA
jgi:[acyl-carrier-protein] S-malonyltransferase